MSGRKEYLEKVMQAAISVDDSEIDAFLDLIEEAYDKGSAIFVIGNGGSASNASHFAQDLSRIGLDDKKSKIKFRVMSLADNVPMMTALTNDIGYESVFSLQLQQYAREGDLLVAISGSGNSPNILKAAEYASANGMKIVSVTGFDGGKLLSMADIKLHVPLDDMAKAESVHSVYFHMMTDFFRDRVRSR